MIINQLHHNRWNIINLYSENLYYVSRDYTIEWEISRDNGKKNILRFHISGNLGKISTDLNDIFDCVELNGKKKLFFNKIKSKEWRYNLTIWIKSLS